MPSFTKSVSTRVSQHRSQDISDEGYDDLDAWMQAVGAFLVYTATWGLLSAYGSYEKYYETTLMSSTPSTTISWVGTLQVVIVICTMTTVLGVMMLSLAHEYYQILLAQGVCIGVGSATLYVPSVSLVASRFQRRRPLAMFFVTSGTAIGGIIYPIIFSTLQPKIGFSWATRVLGFVTLAELIIAMAIMIPRTKKSKGLHQIRSILDPTAFHDPAFVAFCLAIFLMWVSYWVPFFLLPTFALFKVGASSNIAFYVLVICNASTIPGRYLAVPISNRFGPALTMGGFAMASSIILFGWVGVESVTSTIIWAILIALFMGPLGALYPIIVPHVSPKKELVGTRIGISSAAAAFGTLVGFPITSALNDIQTGTFWKSEVLNGSKPHSNDLLPRHIYVSPRPRLTALQLSASKREHSTLWFISRIQEVCCYVQTKWYGATRKKL
uniref:Riboflavin transporter MCH5 n=1 Tax=Talaromyces marneffei PM1 TaxID=1077442 RepID=A0A093VLM3_TALMA